MTSPYISQNVPPTQASGIATSPRPRQQAIQPPNLLTTSLGNARNAGLGIGGITQTPASATTLSSPFAGHPQSPYVQSSGGASRGASPMALRSNSSFSGTYNPQQWGPVNNVSQMSSAREHRRAQSSRVVALAPRPVGPDGMMKTCPVLSEPTDITFSRTCRFSSSTVLTPSGYGVPELAPPPH